MPTYQYACTACDERLEVVQSFTDDPLVECPQCSGRLRKVFNSVGIVFKGSGFYRTDSRADTSTSDNASAAKSDTKGEAKSTSGESTSTSSGDTKSGSDSTKGSAGSSSTAGSAA